MKKPSAKVHTVRELANLLGISEAQLHRLKPVWPEDPKKGIHLEIWQEWDIKRRAVKEARVGGSLTAKKAAKLDEEVAILRLKREVLACRVIERTRVEEAIRRLLEFARTKLDQWKVPLRTRLEGKSGAELEAAWDDLLDEILAGMRGQYAKWLAGLPEEVKASEAAEPADANADPLSVTGDELGEVVSKE